MFRPYDEERKKDFSKVMDPLKEGNYAEVLIQANLILYNSAYAYDIGIKNLAYNARAKSKLETGDAAAALRDIEEALRFDSQDADAYTIKAEANYRLKKYVEAMADANMVIKKRALIPDAYVTRLQCYIALENADLALKDARTIKAIVTSAIFNHHGSTYRKAELFTMRALAHKVLNDSAAEEADKKEARKLGGKPASVMQKPNLFNTEAERNRLLAEYDANVAFAEEVFKNL
jgi:tetratricopeptide (TPR) repeat protein